MQRLRRVAVTTLSLLMLGAVLVADIAVAQLQSLQEQLVGTWTLVSEDIVRHDGSKDALFGPHPRGMLIYTSDGHFALLQMRADLPTLASRRRDQGTSEEYKAVVQGSIAFFGTYAVHEAEKTLTYQIEGSTFANLVGGREQQRLVTSLTADALTLVNPRTQYGVRLEEGWKRPR